MTYEERENIFSKELLSLSDFEKLFGISKTEACRTVQMIKRQLPKLRVEIKGKLHTQDYIDWLNLSDKDMCRYQSKEAVKDLKPKPRFKSKMIM